MADLANRQEYESRLTSAVASVLRVQRSQVNASSPVPWSAFSRQIRSDHGIGSAMAAPYSAAASSLVNQFGVGIGQSAINQRAEKWASDWQSVLAAGMESTGRDVLTRLGDTPQPEEIEAAFDRLFSDSRADAIGVTETTRAISWGEVAAAGLVETAISMRLEPEWESELGPHTCEVCAGLNGQGRSSWWPRFPFGPPGPHSRCRCKFRWAIRGPIGVNA